MVTINTAKMELKGTKTKRDNYYSRNAGISFQNYHEFRRFHLFDASLNSYQSNLFDDISFSVLTHFAVVLRMCGISSSSGLVCLAFGGSIGITCVILACALPQFNLWWPFFVFAFYILSVFPTLLAKRSESRARIDFSIFLTVGFVLSSFYLPIVMARSHTILWAACYLTITGNVIVYATMFAFFTMLESDNFEYGGGF